MPFITISDEFVNQVKATQELRYQPFIPASLRRRINLSDSDENPEKENSEIIASADMSVRPIISVQSFTTEKESASGVATVIKYSDKLKEDARQLFSQKKYVRGSLKFMHAYFEKLFRNR
jgi:hypothetical protein